MRKLLQFIIALLLTFGAKAQTFTPVHNYQAPDGLEIIKHLGIPYGADTSLYTFPDSVNVGGIPRKSAVLYFQTSDSTLYMHWGKWLKIQGGGGVSGNDSAYVDITGSSDSTELHLRRDNGTTDTIVFEGEGSGGSGVQSVTGTTVNNTDPANPVVNVPSLDDVTGKDSISTHTISVVSPNAGVAAISSIGAISALSISSDGTPTVLLKNDASLGGSYGSIGINNITGLATQWELPNISGTLAEGITDGTTTVHAGIDGIVDISSLIGGSGGGGITQSQLDDSTAAVRNDKQDKLTLTTTGTSGAATLTGSTLNIPQYSGGGGTYTASNGVVLQGNNFKLQDTLNGAGTKIMWIPALKAFRAGYVNGTQWDISNVGSGSSAFGGGGSIASGGNSFALGILTNASGYASFVQGFGSVASGSYSASFGSSFSKALYSFASGDGSEANYYSSLALGSHVSTDSLEGSISLGIWNDRSFNKNRIFQIGIGTSTSDKKNGVTLLNTGKFQLNQYGSGTFIGTPAKQLSVTSTGDVIETNQPIITSGSAAPSSTPAKVGDIYVDTSAKKLYFAAGTSSSSDWVIAN